MKITPEILNEVKAKHIPHARAEDFLTPEESTAESAADMKSAGEYFSAFAAGTPGGECICCGKQQGGRNIMDAALGTAHFTWGLAHGEGFCRNCGWPARAHHDIPQVGRIENLILQYHPDGIEIREEVEP